MFGLDGGYFCVYNAGMQTQTTQIRVTLPVQLQGYLQTKANKYGLSLSAYIRNLIIDDVKDVEYPVYEMSQSSIDALNQAMKEAKAGQLIEADSIDRQPAFS